MRFRALADFESEETKSVYCAGLSYQPDTPALAKLFDEWADAGRMERIPGDAVASVRGRG